MSLLTPEFRVSYANVFKAEKNDLNGNMEYGLVAIFPKTADLSPLKKAAEKTLADELGPDQSKWPSGMRSPFRKCSERWKTVDGKQVIPAGYEDGDAIFITLKQNAEKGKPAVVDENVVEIIEPRFFYSGCYARASVRPYYYDKKGNKGVSFGLNNVQKLRDGDPLGGRSRPQDDFVPVATAAAPAGNEPKSIFG